MIHPFWSVIHRVLRGVELCLCKFTDLFREFLLGTYQFRKGGRFFCVDIVRTVLDRYRWCLLHLGRVFWRRRVRWFCGILELDSRDFKIKIRTVVVWYDNTSQRQEQSDRFFCVGQQSQRAALR